MSGTSADGIDACLVEISGNGLHTRINVLVSETYPYDETTRTAILDTCNPETGTVDKVCQLNFHLGKLFANAATSIANKAHISIKDIDLIGSHGQTIYHLPNQTTMEKTEDRNQKSEVRSNESNSNTVDIDAFKKKCGIYHTFGLRSKLVNLPSLPRKQALRQ